MQTQHPQLAPTAMLAATRLVVKSLPRSIAFYEDAIGLEHLDTVDGVARLGTRGAPAIELVEDPAARRAGRHAGLFHVALNLASRVELARAGARLMRHGAIISGTSDHGTHEAFYLSDPDGNGLELAVDRPRDQWPALHEAYGRQPQPLDVRDLMALVQHEDVAARATEVVVGHLHLHVGDIDRALAFYRDVVGFDLVARLPTAAFLSVGGYHHHLGLNVWQGQDAPPVPDGVVGMASWTLLVPAAELVDALAARLDVAGIPYDIKAGDVVVSDPWNNELRVEADRFAEVPAGRLEPA